MIVKPEISEHPKRSHNRSVVQGSKGTSSTYMILYEYAAIFAFPCHRFREGCENGGHIAGCWETVTGECIQINVILSEFSEGQSADGVPIQANVMIEKWHDAYPQAATPRPE